MQRVNPAQLLAMTALNIVAATPISLKHILGDRLPTWYSLWAAAAIGLVGAIAVYFIARRKIPEDPTTPPPPPPDPGYPTIIAILLAIGGFLLLCIVMFMPLIASFAFGGIVTGADHTPAFALTFITFILTPLAARLHWEKRQ